MAVISGAAKTYPRRMLMRRTIFALATILVVFLTVLAVLVVHPVRTVKAHRGCSDRTLMGNYGWQEFGNEYETTSTPHPSFWTETGLVHFDGDGNFSASQGYYIENGAASGPYSATGTYTVESDCTVTITYTSDSSTYIDHGVIVDANGSEVIAVEYDDTVVDTTGHVDIKKMGDSD